MLNKSNNPLQMFLIKILKIKLLHQRSFKPSSNLTSAVSDTVEVPIVLVQGFLVVVVGRFSGTGVVGITSLHSSESLNFTNFSCRKLQKNVNSNPNTRLDLGSRYL